MGLKPVAVTFNDLLQVILILDSPVNPWPIAFENHKTKTVNSIEPILFGGSSA